MARKNPATGIVLPRSCGSPYRVALAGSGVEVRPLGGVPVPGRVQGGAVLYSGAYPQTEVLVAASEASVEEFYYLAGPGAPKVFRHELKASGAAKSFGLAREGNLEARDASGTPILMLSRPVAFDAKGRRRLGAFRLSRTRGIPGPREFPRNQREGGDRDEGAVEAVDAQAKLLQGQGTEKGLGPVVAEDHPGGGLGPLDPRQGQAHLALYHPAVRDLEAAAAARLDADAAQQVGGDEGVGGSGVHDGLQGDRPPAGGGVHDLDRFAKGSHATSIPENPRPVHGASSRRALGHGKSNGSRLPPAPAGDYEIALSFDPWGLDYPFLIDPAWTTAGAHAVSKVWTGFRSRENALRSQEAIWALEITEAKPRSES